MKQVVTSMDNMHALIQPVHSIALEIRGDITGNCEACHDFLLLPWMLPMMVILPHVLILFGELNKFFTSPFNLFFQVWSVVVRQLPWTLIIEDPRISLRQALMHSSQKCRHKFIWIS